MATTNEPNAKVYEEIMADLIPDTDYADTNIETFLSSVANFMIDYTTCIYQFISVPDSSTNYYILYFSYNLVDFYLKFTKGTKNAELYKRTYDDSGDYVSRKTYTYSNLDSFMNALLNDVDKLSVLNKL